MLSFDITDNQIKIVKGSQIANKTKITNAIVIDIPNGYINDGFVSDIARLAGLINDRMRNASLFDKECVVSISSSLVVFNEMIVPKVKPTQIMPIIQNKIKSTMGVQSNYSISYSIVGEVQEQKSTAYKALVSACPYDIVNCYKKLFSMLQLQLKSAYVSCNCISRIILNDSRNKERMPLLVVQVDKNFLSLTLYDKQQLVFSRFVTIKKEDYDVEDYVTEAMNENVFRMIQFYKSRGGTSLKDIIFYGDVREFIKLTRSLEQQDVRTYILSVPDQVSGYENVEFTTYANAIGALYKDNKETERLNLIAADAAVKDEKDNSLTKSIVIVALISFAIIGAFYSVLMLKQHSIQKDIDEANAYIEDSQEQLAIINQKNVMLEKINNYKNEATKANENLKTQPIINTKTTNVIKDAAVKLGVVTDISYENGLISVTYRVPDITYPAVIVENLNKSNHFANVLYTGNEMKEVLEDIIDDEENDTNDQNDTADDQTEEDTKSKLKYEDISDYCNYTFTVQLTMKAGE